MYCHQCGITLLIGLSAEMTSRLLSDIKKTHFCFWRNNNWQENIHMLQNTSTAPIMTRVSELETRVHNIPSIECGAGGASKPYSLHPTSVLSVTWKVQRRRRGNLCADASSAATNLVRSKQPTPQGLLLGSRNTRSSLQNRAKLHGRRTRL